MPEHRIFDNFGPGAKVIKQRQIGAISTKTTEDDVWLGCFLEKKHLHGPSKRPNPENGTIRPGRNRSCSRDWNHLRGCRVVPFPGKRHFQTDPRVIFEKK